MLKFNLCIVSSYGDILQQRNRDIKSMDAGLALTLITLLAYQFFPDKMVVIIATLLLLLCMTAPRSFAPFARFWFYMADHLAAAVSLLLLTLVFFLMVTPAAVIRRMMGKDTLKLKTWRSGSMTLFTTKNHRWLPADMDKPY